MLSLAPTQKMQLTNTFNDFGIILGAERLTSSPQAPVLSGIYGPPTVRHGQCIHPHSSMAQTSSLSCIAEMLKLIQGLNINLLFFIF